ncbi:alkaline phosphatase-like protein, partial [Atractiella rhizophila]
FLAISLLHLSALYLFTSGFLLRRITLPNTSVLSAPIESNSRPKLIWLIIDALRDDFLFTHPSFPTPARLAKEHPENSFMARFVADPPTTTLQRIKGLTTGSLPTFIDMSANFAAGRGAEGTVGEDNLLRQMKQNGLRVAFVGDDTWIGAFSGEDVWATGMSWGYDSLDVADLDTVDRGVTEKLRWLLAEGEGRGSWDVAIAHALGVDHAGHTYGPQHDEMKRKLKEMDELVSELVEKMDDDALLVVCGDHGMDGKGDHGGDSESELNAGVWVYSKRNVRHRSLLEGLVEDRTATGRRVVRQIDIVPTLAHLLNIPVPFNNLGMIIPELFHPEIQSRVIRDTALQLAEYLNISVQSGVSDLAHSLGELMGIFSEGERLYSEGHHQTAMASFFQFSRRTLEHSRAVWARFDWPLMLGGIVVLLLSCLVTWNLVYKPHNAVTRSACLKSGVRGAIVGGIPLSVLSAVAGTGSRGRAGLQEVFIFSLSFTFALGMLSASSNTSNGQQTRLSVEGLFGLALPFLHAALFASNSFTIWEDKAALLLLQSCLLYLACRSFAVPDPRLRKRLWFFLAIILLLIRWIASFTVCREEQQPFCSITFYADRRHEGTSLSPAPVIVILPILASLVPELLGRFLDISQSRKGVARLWLGWGCRFCLFGAILFWGPEDVFGHYPQLKGLIWFPDQLKHWIARAVLVFSLVGGSLIWWYSPLSVDVTKEATKNVFGESKTRITIVGFANAFGSSYLLFLTCLWCLVILVSLPTSQLVLMLGMIAFFGLTEVFDSWADATSLLRVVESKKDAAPAQGHQFIFRTSILSILSFVLYFATGHQATLSSIQWKTAFVGVRTVVYPISPVFVIINTLGPFLLIAAGVPLLSLWNTSPILSTPSSVNKDSPAQKLAITDSLTRNSLSFVLYHSIITLSSMIFAAHFRRHLMVWKIFAPRFMLGGITLLSVD